MEEERSRKEKEGGKAKGKGKKGPAGGCLDCGGDHFKVNCPNNKGKGKGGKGKPNHYFPETWWNQQYPHTGYHSGGKGKASGKGKGFAAHLTWPTLGAVSHPEQPENQQGYQGDEQDDWSQGYQSYGGTIGSLT